jgi:chorismate mutase
MSGELARLRAEVEAVDRALVETINRRLELVLRIREHKHETGTPLRDPERERRQTELLATANRGPLTPQGLERIYAEILALTRRELDLGD